MSLCPLMLECWLACSYAGLVQAATQLWAYEHSCSVISRRCCFAAVLPCFLLRWSWALGRECDTELIFVVERSSDALTSWGFLYEPRWDRVLMNLRLGSNSLCIVEDKLDSSSCHPFHILGLQAWATAPSLLLGVIFLIWSFSLPNEGNGRQDSQWRMTADPSDRDLRNRHRSSMLFLSSV